MFKAVFKGDTGLMGSLIHSIDPAVQCGLPGAASGMFAGGGVST